MIAGMADNPPRQRAQMFLNAEDDPRSDGPRLGDERVTLAEYLRVQRITLELKCSGLDAADLARRAVEPSTLSLLGLLRHMAKVEHIWFRQRMAGQDLPRLYTSAADPDGDFDGAVPDEAVVKEAWESWRREVAFAERFVAGAPNLDITCEARDGTMSLREVLVHMVEEYARHNGHADLLRERIDGRIGL
jgi:uncharacterized damage-inducible protein DinB